MANHRDFSRPRQAPGRPSQPEAGPTGATSDTATRWRNLLLKAAVIVLAALWVYSPVCHPVHHADWLWDDDQLLTANLTVQHRLSPDPSVPPDDLSTLLKLWFSPDGADYFPLSYTALWAQWPFFQMDPRTGGPPQVGGPSAPWPTGYHATSVVLHVIGSLLLWRLFAAMKIPFAWFGAALFAVHPVCVESVAWVSELKNTLSMPLFLLAAINFVKFDDATDEDGRRWSCYALAIVFFLLAMFAKTSVVMFPFAIILYGWWKRGFALDRSGLAALMLVGAGLVITLLPELWWLKALGKGQSTWMTFLASQVIAAIGVPVSILAVALTSPDHNEGQTTRSRRDSMWTYVAYALPFFWISLGLGLCTYYYQHARAIGQETINVPSYLGNGVAAYRDGIIRIAVDEKTSDRTVAIHSRDEKLMFKGPLNQEADYAAVPTEWQNRVRSISSGIGLPSIKGILSRLAIAGTSLLFYLATVFWPVNLLPIYTRWDIDLLDMSKGSQVVEMLAYLLPIPVILASAWWFWQNRATWGRHVIFGVGFFLLMVAPVLGFVTISYMRITWAADHFIYLPMIGVIALIAAAVAGWYDRLPTGERPLLVAGCAAGLAVLTWISYGLAVTWVNEDQLWTHTLQHNENAWQAHNRLGAKKFARGHVDDIPVPSVSQLDPATQVKIKGALHHFTRSTALRPDLGETHNNLGTALSAKGRLDEAIEQFKEAVRVTPHVPAIHINLANALAAGGRFPEAEMKYLELIQGIEKAHADAIKATGNPNIPLDPGVAALINNYGVTLFKQGKKDEAITAFRRALAINPTLKDARESLALATGETPMPAEATPPAAERPPAPSPSPPTPLPMSVPQSPTLGPTSP